jgi:hypothetical protein
LLPSIETQHDESSIQGTQKPADRVQPAYVEKLQDHLLEQVERFAEEHPDCDRAAYPVAVGQAFVAQCLKTYGVEGFEQARQHATLIIDAVEHAYRGS